LWRDLYLRWSIDLSKEKEVWKDIEEIVRKNKNLKAKASNLRNVLNDLEKEIVHLNDVKNITA
jgi:uncharacterized coiled-coil DUF342 family protein